MQVGEKWKVSAKSALTTERLIKQIKHGPFWLVFFIGKKAISILEVRTIFLKIKQFALNENGNELSFVINSS